MFTFPKNPNDLYFKENAFNYFSHRSTVHLFTAGNLAIILSSDSGTVCGVLPSNVLWRINLNELKLNEVNQGIEEKYSSSEE